MSLRHRARHSRLPGERRNEANRCQARIQRRSRQRRLFSVQALRNVGSVLREWRGEWRQRLEQAPDVSDLDLPSGDMQPLGYVMQHAVYANRPVRACRTWAERIPDVYAEAVSGRDRDLGTSAAGAGDPDCLATLRHYRSLMAMAHEAC